MKAGDTVISAKDHSPEILVLRSDGNLYGNRTAYNYGKMAEEENKTNQEESEEKSKEVEKRFEEIEKRLDALESDGENN